MKYRLSEIGNREIAEADVKIETCGEDGLFHGIEFRSSVKCVSMDAGGRAVGICGMSFDGGNSARVELADGQFYSRMGQPFLSKPEGTLLLEIRGNVEISGSDASFGPTSFGENSAIVADRIEVRLAEGAKLTLNGGKTFASLFYGADCHAQALRCNKLVSECTVTETEGKTVIEKVSDQAKQ